ncbi:MAG: hypothetical protein K0U20_08735 [Proteobacteria bacterium]|nr:hypothetical protein [Pseudomonadota bacterium]
MSPITTINGCDLWFSEDDDAQGDGGYYWQDPDFVTSDVSYHTKDNAIEAMDAGEVTFTN